MTDESLFEEKYEEVLRWITEKPVLVPPSLGTLPAYLADEKHISLGTEGRARRVKYSFIEGKTNSFGVLKYYLSTFVENLDRLRMVRRNGDDAENVMTLEESIKKFIPHRDELVDVLRTVFSYSNTEQPIQEVHHFLEEFHKYTYRPEYYSKCQSNEFDNFKIYLLEIFLSIIALLIKNENFVGAKYLLTKQYLTSNDYRHELYLNWYSVFSEVNSDLLKDHWETLIEPLKKIDG